MLTLSELRARKNITQKSMAERLKIATSTYNQYETGERMIPVAKAEKIANILGLEMSDVFLPCKFTVIKPQ